MSEHQVSSTRVWFGTRMREGASQVFVETRDRLGILFALVAAIGAKRESAGVLSARPPIGRPRVTILESDAGTADRLSRDWFFVRS